MRYYFVVAAAGVGKRMGSNIPKQFLEYKGKPLYINAVKELVKTDIVTDIIIVTSTENIQKVKEHCKMFEKSNIKVIGGGKERQDSIYNAIKYIKQTAGNNDIIGIQDGARPHLKREYIEDTYKKLIDTKDAAGIVVGVPVKDTVKILDSEGNIKETPQRKHLFAAHTPQIFYAKEIINAYEKAYTDGYYGTDDASLVERVEKKVLVFVGSYDNIKITTVEDLIYLK